MPQYHEKIKQITASIALSHGNQAIVAPILGEVIDSKKRLCRIRLGLVLKRHPSPGLLSHARIVHTIDTSRIRDSDWIYSGTVDRVEVVFEIVTTSEDYETSRNIFKTHNFLAQIPSDATAT